MPKRLSFSEFASRSRSPEPWSEGEKIPWDDAAFSSRMLEEHLSQDHDMASRRSATIDTQVEILNSMIGSDQAKILDLGCGPGLYCQRFARLGHRCSGIDFSPASIAYACHHSVFERLDITYCQGDIRTVPYPSGQDMVLMLFGEFNVFRPEDALSISIKAKEALRPGGLFVVEMSTFDSIYSQGHGQPFWRALAHGLFSDKPHLWLYEASWDPSKKACTDRHFILEESAHEVIEYASSAMAYTKAEIEAMLVKAGFSDVRVSDWSELGLNYGSGEFHVVIAS